MIKSKALSHFDMPEKNHPMVEQESRNTPREAVNVTHMIEKTLPDMRREGLKTNI